MSIVPIQFQAMSRKFDYSSNTIPGQEGNMMGSDGVFNVNIVTAVAFADLRD